MFPFNISDQIKAAVATGTILVSLAGGYVGMQKDIHAVDSKIDETMQVNEKQDTTIQTDHETVARVDERTRIMMEQLARIEKNTAPR